MIDGKQMRKVGELGEGCILGLGALLCRSDTSSIWKWVDAGETVGAVSPHTVQVCHNNFDTQLQFPIMKVQQKGQQWNGMLYIHDR